MTPHEFKAIRRSLGLTQPQLAAVLGYASRNGVAILETTLSGRTVPPCVDRLMRAYEAGYRPADWPTRTLADRTAEHKALGFKPGIGEIEER